MNLRSKLADEEWQVRLALMSLDTGIKLQTPEGISQDYLESDEFRRLWVQAKFYRGDVAYSREEVPILKQWLEHSNPQLMRDVFYNQVLRWKPAKRRLFKGHVLDRVLSDLGQH